MNQKFKDVFKGKVVNIPESIVNQYPCVINSNRGSAEYAVAAGVDAEIIAKFQADVVEPLAVLPRLEPNGAANPRCPFSARLVWRFMNVAATAEEGLHLLNEARDGWRSNLATIVADVHAKTGGWTVDKPDAAPDFIGREL